VPPLEKISINNVGTYIGTIKNKVTNYNTVTRNRPSIVVIDWHNFTVGIISIAILITYKLLNYNKL